MTNIKKRLRRPQVHATIHPALYVKIVDLARYYTMASIISKALQLYFDLRKVAQGKARFMFYNAQGEKEYFPLGSYIDSDVLSPAHEREKVMMRREAEAEVIMRQPIHRPEHTLKEISEFETRDEFLKRKSKEDLFGYNEGIYHDMIGFDETTERLVKEGKDV